MNKLVKTVAAVCLAGLLFLCLAPTSSMNQYYGSFFGGLTGTKDSNLNGYSITNGNTIQATNINATILNVGILNLTNGLNGTMFAFYTIVPFSQGTNFILDFTNGFNAKIALTNDFVMLYHTNGPGDFKIKMRPGGANRNIWIPTNWVTASTNIVPYLDGATGKYWVYTLTNAANGMGPRVGMLVGSADGIYDTNMVYRFFETP